jgi:hypothetical protein
MVANQHRQGGDPERSNAALIYGPLSHPTANSRQAIEARARQRQKSSPPSPTTVLGILPGSFALKEYFRSQVFEATQHHTERTGWSDDDHFAMR